jgi:hypothetical protein
LNFREKHLIQISILVIRSATFRHEVSIPDLMNWIFDRMRKQDVVITVKSLILIHDLMRNGSPRVMDYLSTVSYFFHQHDIHPLDSSGGNYNLFSKVIEKLDVFENVKLDYMKASASDISSRMQYTLSPEICKFNVRCLQNQLDSILYTKVGEFNFMT